MFLSLVLFIISTYIIGIGSQTPLLWKKSFFYTYVYIDIIITQRVRGYSVLLKTARIYIYFKTVFDTSTSSILFFTFLLVRNSTSLYYCSEMESENA